jgi:hypothetical protein
VSPLFNPGKIDDEGSFDYAIGMDKQSRREAIRDYKERKTRAGVYAVRCVATGDVWIAGAANVEGQKARHWFGLRMGSHTNKAIQAAWAVHGEAAMAFEIVENIEAEELTPLGLADLIKARERHWLAALGAKKAVG